MSKYVLGESFSTTTAAVTRRLKNLQHIGHQVLLTLTDAIIASDKEGILQVTPWTMEAPFDLKVDRDNQRKRIFALQVREMDGSTNGVWAMEIHYFGKPGNLLICQRRGVDTTIEVSATQAIKEFVETALGPILSAAPSEEKAGRPGRGKPHAKVKRAPR